MKIKYTPAGCRKQGDAFKRFWLNEGLPFFAIFLIFLVLFPSRARSEAEFSEQFLLISEIQGFGHVSPYLNEWVNFRGIVTGIREDQNLEGIRYYTLFVQDLDSRKDEAAGTSDGIAIFHGRRRPTAQLGDLLTISGIVTEYYGLTEIDDRGLSITIDVHGQALPDAIPLYPPENVSEAVDYYERLEGMLVKLQKGNVVGPTHPGCGFSVIHPDVGKHRIMKHTAEAIVGQVVSVLNWTDVDCKNFPDVSVGDTVSGLVGPLTYDFQNYKVIQQPENQLGVKHQASSSQSLPAPLQLEDAVTFATFNLNNFFDSKSDSTNDSEPIIPPEELELKQTKIAYAITDIVKCPTILALQEVENRSLLNGLVSQLAKGCGFIYMILHRESADARGADVALLVNPTIVGVTDIRQHQSCTGIDTGIIDATISCPNGSQPLFSRQPLQVDLVIDQVPVSVIVVHLKSKREGEEETESRRLAQADLISHVVENMFSSSSVRRVVVLGDFNDYSQSPVLLKLKSNGLLVDSFGSLPEDQRYSYIFDGASQLIDGILVSKGLSDKVVQTHIFHINADYPYSMALEVEGERTAFRSSDHDIPWIALQFRRVTIHEQQTVEEQHPQPADDNNTSASEAIGTISIQRSVPSSQSSPSNLPTNPRNEDEFFDNQDTTAPSNPTNQEPEGNGSQAPILLLIFIVVAILLVVRFARRIW